MRRSFLFLGLGLSFLSVAPLAAQILPPDGSCFVRDNTVILRWDLSPRFGEIIPPERGITVSRDGEVIAKLPLKTTSYVDRNVPAGRHHYVVSAQIGDPVILLLECSVRVPGYPPPRDLTCRVVCSEGSPPLDPGDIPNGEIGYCNVVLTWQNPIHYAAIIVVRDGTCIALLPGHAEKYVDLDVSPGEHTYKVAGLVYEMIPEGLKEVIEALNSSSTAPDMPEIIPKVCPLLEAGASFAECTVVVPPQQPKPGPSDLVCKYIDVKMWVEVPEVGEIPPQVRPNLPFRGVLLVWKNNADYQHIVVLRNEEIIARLPGDAFYYFDAGVAPGEYVYSVYAVIDNTKTDATRCKVIVPGPSELPPPYDLACKVACPFVSPGPDLNPPCEDCPVRCVVSLSWKNGARYDQIKVYRNGELLETLPGEAEQFVDRAPPPGVNVYAVRGFRAEKESRAVRCEVRVPPFPPILPPRNLICKSSCTESADGSSACSVKLSWENPQEYQKVLVFRNGEVIAELPGDATEYVDSQVPEGTHLYGVSGGIDSILSRPATCRVTVPPPPLKPPYDLVCVPGGGPEPVPVPGLNNDAEGGSPIPERVVLLRWVNGSQYEAVIVRRDGEEIAKLPGSTQRYLDLNVPPGEHIYAVSGVRDGVETEPATCKVVIGAPVPPVSDLKCAVDPNDPSETQSPDIITPAVLLTWSIPEGVTYDSIRIYRNGSLVAKLGGTETEFRDRGLLPGLYNYAVAGVIGGRQSIPRHCEVFVPGPLPPPQELSCRVTSISPGPNSEVPERLVVELRWKNPVKYLAIVIRRNGEQLAELPGNAEYFLDKSPDGEGVLVYEVRGVGQDGALTDPATCEVSLLPPPLPPTNLECVAQGNKVSLTWDNQGEYEKVVIIVIISIDQKRTIELEGKAESFTTEELQPGKYCFVVYGVVGDRRTEGVRCCVVVPSEGLKNLLYFSPVTEKAQKTGVAVCMADNKDPVEGWSFGVCNNPSRIRPVEATVEGTFAGEIDLGYLSISLYDEGVTMAAVVQPIPKEELPPEKAEEPLTSIEPGRGRSLLKVSYNLVENKAEDMPPAPNLHPIHYCSTLGDPPVAVIFVVEGIEVSPQTLPGFVRIPTKQFIRGDANADGTVDLADVIFELNYLFAHGAQPPCLAAADANLTREVNIADSVYLLNWLFSGGPPPPAPFKQCGNYIPSRDRLPCESYEACP